MNADSMEDQKSFDSPRIFDDRNIEKVLTFSDLFEYLQHDFPAADEEIITNNSNLYNLATAKRFEHKCASKKQHQKVLFFVYLLLKDESAYNPKEVKTRSVFQSFLSNSHLFLEHNGTYYLHSVDRKSTQVKSVQNALQLYKDFWPKCNAMDQLDITTGLLKLAEASDMRDSTGNLRCFDVVMGYLIHCLLTTSGMPGMPGMPGRYCTLFYF